MGRNNGPRPGWSERGRSRLPRGPGYDQFNVTGAVGLNGPMLVASLESASAVGDTFSILTSGGGISGTFDGHPDGDIFPIDGARFRINYTADSVVLTHIADPADHFVISAPDTATPGVPFDVTVYALDPNGNVDPTYTGTVTFTSSDTHSSVSLPAAYTFTTFTTGSGAENGVHTFTDTGLGETTLITPGDQTLTATDTASGIVGSATVTVTLAPAPPGGQGNSQVGLGVRNQAPLVPTVVFALAEAALPLPAARESVSPLGADATPRALDTWAVDRLFAMEPEGRGLAVYGWQHATRQGIHDSSAHGLLQDHWLADGVFA